MNTATQEWARIPFGDAPLVGDPSLHLTAEQLESAFAGVENTYAANHAVLAAIVVREVDGRRGQPATATVTTDGGLEGDRWVTGKANPGDQLSMMNVEVASRIANGQSVALFGDNLFTDLDVGEAALPVGTRLAIGEVVLRVSAEPHVPCDRFRSRFGHAAFLRAAADHRIRGVYLTVERGGVISLDDPIRLD